MKNNRNLRLDILKAVGIVFVLLLHLQPIQIVNEVPAYIRADNILEFFLEFFYWQVFFTAVPIFLIVSLYLFYLKIDTTYAYLKKRILHLGKIFIFWSVVQVIVGTLALGKFPPLPFVGDSVFYYLFNLLLILFIAFYYIRINEKIRKIIAISSVVGSLLYFEFMGLRGLSIHYWSIKNFIIYIPLAHYLVANSQEIFKFKNYYFVGYIIFSIQDFYLRHSFEVQSHYGRVSVILGTLALLSFIYSLKDIKEFWIVKELAKYSLGLYAIHKYWQYLFLLLMKSYDINIIFFNLDIGASIVAIMALSFTLISVYILRLTPLKMFVA